MVARQGGGGGLVAWFASLPREIAEARSSVLSSFVIFTVIVVFLTMAALRRQPVFETFVEGAKDGFKVAVEIIPYLVAMLVAIGVLRASGTLDLLLAPVRWSVAGLGLDTRWVEALPTALLRPLSGSGARGMMIETMTTAQTFDLRLVSRPFQGFHRTLRAAYRRCAP